MPPLTPAAAVELFTATDSAASVGPRDTAVRALALYAAFLEARRLGLDEVGPQEVEEFLATVARFRDDRAYRPVVRAVRGLHAYAVSERWAPVDPTADLVAPAAAGPRAPSVREPLGQFLDQVALTKARNTAAAYGRDVVAYEEFLACRGTGLHDATERDVQAYVGLLRRSRKDSSVARALSAIRQLHQFCADEQGFSTDPTADVRAPSIPEALPKALSEEEVGRLLASPAGDDPATLRDRALLELLYGTGMRISEAVGLSLADLHLDEGVARVLGKGSKERVVPVGRFAREAVEDYLHRGRHALAPTRWPSADAREALFLNHRGGRLSRQGAWGIVRSHGRAAGIPDSRLSPHVLRHSCATHMLEHGASIRDVQELLGHASVATTQRYTRVQMDLVHRTYLAAHPRARGAPSG